MKTWCCLIFRHCRFSTWVNSEYNSQNLVNEESVEKFSGVARDAPSVELGN